MPARREPIDGLEANTPAVVNDSLQQLIGGVKGLCRLSRMRPCRPLFREPRVVLIVDRDRAYRTDPDSMGLIVWRNLPHEFGIGARWRFSSE